MSEKSKNDSRRAFLGKFTKAVVGASVFPAIVTAADKQRNVQSLLRTPQKFSANDNIQIALIGAGGMGNADADTAVLVVWAMLMQILPLLYRV
jgi:hypothetical protein